MCVCICVFVCIYRRLGGYTFISSNWITHNYCFFASFCVVLFVSSLDSLSLCVCAYCEQPASNKDGFVFAIPRSSSTGRGVRNKNSSSSSYRLLHEKKPFRDTLISIWCVNALFCFLFWLFVCVCVRTVTPSENKDGFVFAIPHSSSRRCIIVLDGVFVTWIHLRHHSGYFTAWKEAVSGYFANSFFVSKFACTSNFATKYDWNRTVHWSRPVWSVVRNAGFVCVCAHYQYK